MKTLVKLTLLSIFFVPASASAQSYLDITFPVDGPTSYQDDFFDARSGGRYHEATDILSDKMTPILSATDGEVVFAPTPEPYYGYMLSIRADDDYTYHYIHINNDTPGTDDGLGGVENAYVPGIKKGTRVTAGQHIAWVGDSGNAEGTASHLHFEIEAPDGEMVNPYPFLLEAQTGPSYDPDVEVAAASTINDDQDIPEPEGEVFCDSDSLIRSETFSTVYYCGRDGGRYVFQNEDSFFSWYDDFDDVEVVSDETLASVPLKGIVTYRPGTFLVKIVSIPKVYALARNGTLRWVPSESHAEELFGSDWAENVRDIPDTFFSRYQVGKDILVP